MKTLLLTVALLLAALPLTAQAQDAPKVIPLWEKGAPGFEDRRDEPEQAASYWVKNVHNPSLTVFLPPKDKATGAAVIVCPGGGFKELGFNGEGVAPAQFLTNLGIAAFAFALDDLFVGLAARFPVRALKFHVGQFDPRHRAVGILR